MSELGRELMRGVVVGTGKRLDEAGQRLVTLLDRSYTQFRSCGRSAVGASFGHKSYMRVGQPSNQEHHSGSLISDWQTGTIVSSSPSVSDHFTGSQPSGSISNAS